MSSIWKWRYYFRTRGKKKENKRFWAKHKFSV